MPQARGTQLAVNLYEETTYGEDPGAPDGQKAYVKSIGPGATQNLIESETLTGSRTKSKPVQGNVDVGYDVPMEMAPESIGTWLKHALGQVATSGIDPYTHVISIGDLPVGLLVERDYGSNISGSGRFMRHNGIRVASAAFSFPQEGFPEVTFSLKGAKETLSDSALDATPTDNGHEPWNGFQASIEEGGSAIATVTALEFSLNNNLDESAYVIGENERQDLAEGQAVVEGQLTAMFDSATLLNKAINYTESSLKVTLSRGDGLGSAGNESLEFSLPNLVYERQSPGVEGPGGILVTLPFKSYGATTLQATLKNALATI